MVTILCKILECCPAVYIFIASFLVFFVICRFTCKDQVNMKAAIIFCLILSTGSTYMVYKKTKNKWPGIQNALCVENAPKTNYLYDTDFKNDNFIKGPLTDQQLRILDQLLTKEKNDCGLRLSEADLNRISKNNNEINDAYTRWRKCKDMMRSSHHVIYPDERNLYQKKQK